METLLAMHILLHIMPLKVFLIFFVCFYFAACFVDCINIFFIIFLWTAFGRAFLGVHTILLRHFIGFISK